MFMTRTLVSLALAALVPPLSVFAADVDRGAAIALQGTSTGVPACSSCHGPEGMGQAQAAYPRIAGLHAGYLARQLKAFRSGARANAIMGAMIKSLTDEDIADVAAYYGSLEVPAPQVDAPSSTQTELALPLALFGDWSGRDLPACGQCHGPEGQGIGASFPGIAGQHASYLKAQLLAWRSGERTNDPLGLMASVARRLTAAEIEALAAYYAAQPAGTPVAAPSNPAPRRPAAVLPDAEAMHSGAIIDAERVQPPDAHAADPPRDPASEQHRTAGVFSPPPRDHLPQGPLGQMVRFGEAIFNATNVHPLSAPFVGNRLACRHCHLDAGRLPDAGPLWAAWVAYPDYRQKNRRVNTFAERVQSCFVYSLDAQHSLAGGPPAVDSEVMDALMSYSYWIATGAPTGDRQMPGRGYRRLDAPERPGDGGFDAGRGEQLYQQACALCHGDEGQGVSDPAGRTLFPPLWGEGSYNWGAGMRRIDVAAGFIKHNMPLGLPEWLSDQQAWDVAAYLNSHERPQDPRFDGDLASTAARFHADPFVLYGKYPAADGHLLGSQPAQPNSGPADQ